MSPIGATPWRGYSSKDVQELQEIVGVALFTFRAPLMVKEWLHGVGSNPLASSALQVQALFPSFATMKRNYSAFAEDIPPYSGPKAARETYSDLKQLSAIPGHIYTRPELQMPWLVPMLELLPPTSIGHLKEWGLSTVFVLAKNYNKLVHVWESVTAMVELWHPQTNSFIFPEFEATILLEELEIMLGLPRYQRGGESAISYTVEQINSWSILAYITTKKNDLYSMTSGMHVHLLPIAQWITSQCKRKTTNYTAIAKAVAICICGVILFPEADGAISFGNLSIIDSISEGMKIGQAVLGFLYAGLTSAALGGPFYGSVVALELWMGMHIQFRAAEDPKMECKTMLNHPLAYVGGRLHMSTRAWCKTAQVKGIQAWRKYLRSLTVADFDMRPRFMHGRTIHLSQRTGLTLRLLGNGALASYTRTAVTSNAVRLARWFHFYRTSHLPKRGRGVMHKTSVTCVAPSSTGRDAR
ncbi:hypothetical protein Taro_036801 [Colocasia esculenta]|uniref:Aminotransferase-like plant mobile domain-containing protein n=1 Tax=Colocasia esculenta TaxID=4460 RepID=A0A843WEE1_COLES|nr:hypothetical protein [Colocasia esculenta]